MKIKEGYILDEIGDQKVAISLKCGADFQPGRCSVR